MDTITTFNTTDVQLLSEAGVFGDRGASAREKFLKDGKLPLKIIAPGWGSSGYYGADVLGEAAQAGVFPKGTKMYWDHPSLTEAIERPERSLRDLAATFDTPARWEPNGPRGPGLYTDVTVLSQFRESVWEMAPHIGPSIRALGNTKFGEAEGKKGPIVESIIAAQSVDFVTAPGRGGEIIQLFEAARPAATITPPPPTPNSEDNAVELQEAQRQLTESQTKVTQLEETIRTITSERDEARNEVSRLREAGILREARDFVAEELAKVQALPDITRTRLVESISFNPPVTEDKKGLDKDKLRTKIQESVKAEAEYLSTILEAGRVRGNGSAGANGAGSDDAAMTELSEAFQGAFGMDEKAAKAAAAGR